MKTLRYDGQNVYTNSTNRVTVPDLKRAKVEPAKIREVSFYDIDTPNMVKTDFNKNRILKEKSGLYVLVNFESYGTAGVLIAGLDRICSFLADIQSLGSDLSVLEGRGVTSYNKEKKLIGIGVNA